MTVTHWNDNWQSEPRLPDNPINRNPPTRFPFLSELMRDRTVLAALDQAWRDTNADVRPITAACEQGGWIYMDLRTGRLTIRRKANQLTPPRTPAENEGGYSRIDLNNPPAVPGSVVVANFHTHPATPFGGPSDPDFDLAMQYGVPGIVRGQRGVGVVEYGMTGPPRRVGDFRTASRAPGYPGNQWG